MKIKKTPYNILMLFISFLSIAPLLSSCNHHDNNNGSFPDLEPHEEMVNGFKIRFFLPSRYTKSIREERCRSGIFGDMTIMDDDSVVVLFSEKEIRSYFAIMADNIGKEYFPQWHSDYIKGGEYYLDSTITAEQLSNDKGFIYRMPLVKKRKDKDGHPITVIQYVTRYGKSDPDVIMWLDYENTLERDSVEAIFDFITIIDTNIIECYYYSLDSYNHFSYEQFLKIAESITLSK